MILIFTKSLEILLKVLYPEVLSLQLVFAFPITSDPGEQSKEEMCE